MKVLISALIIMTAGCSVMTKNMVRKGDLTLRGGVVRDKKWNDTLVFKRTSWFQELTLGYDLLLVDIDSGNPFWNWFSPSERRALEKCGDSKVMLHYSWDTRRVTYQQIIEELKSQGITTMSIPGFHAQLKMHPNYSFHSLRLYKPLGVCLPKKDHSFVITVPGHNTVKF